MIQEQAFKMVTGKPKLKPAAYAMLCLFDSLGVLVLIPWKSLLGLSSLQTPALCLALGVCYPGNSRVEEGKAVGG